MVDRSDCERVQTAWFEARARLLAGTVWTDGGMRWMDGPDGMNLLFPQEVRRGSVRRAVDRARDLGRDGLGAWLAVDVDATPLADAGFERGWSPWWMTADLSDVPHVRDPRVRLETDTADYSGEHAAYREQLARVVADDSGITWWLRFSAHDRYGRGVVTGSAESDRA